uniref:Neural proliferation, differentiation and control 1 n=1 Tax=Pseudonaja textilis TaxID=8673 RepID=A0A670YIB6_PSETE
MAHVQAGAGRPPREKEATSTLFSFLFVAQRKLTGLQGLCPRHLDCTLQRRKECPLGSHACGSCLPQFVEDREGRCVARKAAPEGKGKGRGIPEAPSALWPAWRGSGLRGASPLLHEGLGRVGYPTALPSSKPLSSLAGLIVSCTAAGVAALVVATICWCRQVLRGMPLGTGAQQRAEGGATDFLQVTDLRSPGDQKLAQSAQMYHYQHQKQQMLSMEKHKEETKAPEPVSSDEENEDGDFTVYECPGLAPTGEMEVKNPLFDDSTLPPKQHP